MPPSGSLQNAFYFPVFVATTPPFTRVPSLRMENHYEKEGGPFIKNWILSQEQEGVITKKPAQDDSIRNAEPSPSTAIIRIKNNMLCVVQKNAREDLKCSESNTWELALRPGLGDRDSKPQLRNHDIRWVTMRLFSPFLSLS